MTARAYQGWQVQKVGTGVQEKIQAVPFVKMFPSVKRIHSSSRTDTGVHALGMVAHVEIPREEFKMPVALDSRSRSTPFCRTISGCCRRCAACRKNLPCAL